MLTQFWHPVSPVRHTCTNSHFSKFRQTMKFPLDFLEFPSSQGARLWPFFFSFFFSFFVSSSEFSLRHSV